MSSVRMDPGRGSRSPLSLPTLSRRQPRGPRSWPSGLPWAPSRPQEPSLTGKTQKGGPAGSTTGEALLQGLRSRDEPLPAGKAPRQKLPPGHVHPHLGTCPASPLARATHDKNSKTCLGGILTSGQPPVAPAPKPEERVKQFNNPLTGRWSDTWEDSGSAAGARPHLFKTGLGKFSRASVVSSCFHNSLLKNDTLVTQP